MKPFPGLFLTGSLSVAFLFAVSPLLQAIPQDFGGGQFFGAVDKPAEAFFASIAAWKPDSKLPGDWVPVEDPPGAVRAKDPGPVFGVKADSLTVVQADDKSVREVSVVYSAKSSGLTEAKLLDRLRTNLANFTSAKPAISKDVERYEGGGLVVELKKAAGGATARLTPAAKPPAGKAAKK